MNTACLSDLPVGRSSEVLRLNTSGPMRRRLMDIGLIPQTRVECLGRSPSGDPSAYMIRGAVIALRREDASTVIIKNI